MKKNNPYPRKRSSEEGNSNPQSSHDHIRDEEVDRLGKRDFSGMEFENEEFGSNRKYTEKVNPEESDIIEVKSETDSNFKEETSPKIKKGKKK